MTREEAVRYFETLLTHVDMEAISGIEASVSIHMAIEALKSQKTGKWIEHEDWYDTYYECSSCGEAFSLIEGTPKDNGYNYCPSCGCRMVGEEE